MDFAFCKTLFQRKAKRFFTPTPPAHGAERGAAPQSVSSSPGVLSFFDKFYILLLLLLVVVFCFLSHGYNPWENIIFAGFTSALFQYKITHVTTIILTGSKTCFQCCCCCCCFLLLLHLLITLVFKWTLLKLQCLIQIQLYVCIDRNCFHIMPGQVNLPSSREGIACTM